MENISAISEELDSLASLIGRSEKPHKAITIGWELKLKALSKRLREEIETMSTATPAVEVSTAP